MGKDEKLEAYRLEHEQYLSEFRIVLTTALTIIFGIIISGSLLSKPPLLSGG